MHVIVFCFRWILSFILLNWLSDQVLWLVLDFCDGFVIWVLQKLWSFWLFPCKTLLYNCNLCFWCSMMEAPFAYLDRFDRADPTRLSYNEFTWIKFSILMSKFFPFSGVFRRWEYPFPEDSYASLQSHLLLVYIKFTKLFKGFGFLCLAPTQLEALKSFLIWFGWTVIRWFVLNYDQVLFNVWCFDLKFFECSSPSSCLFVSLTLFPMTCWMDITCSCCIMCWCTCCHIHSFFIGMLSICRFELDMKFVDQ